MRWLIVLLVAACAAQPEPAAEEQRPAGPDALLPGSIGVLAADRAGGLVVAAVRQDGPAAAAGVRAGDVVLRYNGVRVSGLRQFNRWVLDTPPGSMARIELLRDGERRVVEIPVRELDIVPRV
jgi:S1-C subfamily serine protease